MPSRVLVIYPEPATPQVVDRAAEKRPIRGEDYDLIRGEWNGEEYEYEIWVMPASSDCC
jgi:hypothetical protein